MVVIAEPGSWGTAAQVRYPALDALRGLAALGVVYHHIPVAPDLAMANWDRNFARLVDLFFVISGFVITSAYGAKLVEKYSIARFMFLRWARLWPLHAFMLGLTLIGIIVLEMVRPGPRGDGMVAGRYQLVDLPSALLLLNGFLPSSGMAWNQPSWSVSIEMALYALAAVAWRSIGNRATVGWALASGLCLCALSLFPDTLGYLYDFARGISGFGLGVVLHAVLIRRKHLELRSLPCTVIEVLAFTGIAVLLASSGSAPVFDLLAVVLVGVAAIGKGLVSRILLARPFQVLGALSYALYLVHAFVVGRVFDVLALTQASLGLAVADARLGSADALVGPVWQAFLAKVTIIAICLVAAWIVSIRIEMPARAWSRRTAAVRFVHAEAPN